MQPLMHTMDMAKKNPGISIQISVTPSAKQAVDALAKHTDIPQKRVLSKLYEWFAELPVPAQKSILWPEETVDETDAVRVALEYLASRRKELANSASERPQSSGPSKAETVRNAASKALAESRVKSPKELAPNQ